MNKSEKSPQEKIFILIPALNEERGIALILDEIPNLDAKIIVIDNGSKDKTVETAIARGATVIHEKRRGYGYGCVAGVRYLEGKADAGDLVVFLDADYSDFPEDLIQLIAAIKVSGPDLVMGKRLENLDPGAMSPHAVIANRVFTSLIRLLYGVKLNDMGPMRVIRYETLLELNMQDTGYGWAAEMIVKTIKLGFVIQEVKVQYRPRIGQSKISGSLFTSLRAAIWLSFYILRYGLKSRSN
ncbi:MAG: glycosyltransferase family 2 protein [Candidatus Kariarchaeaceae archaeon]